MPLSDILLTTKWWGALFLIGAAAFPASSAIFRRWHDRGYIFSKAVGFALVGWIVYILGMSKLGSFSLLTILVSIGGVFAGGILAQMGGKGDTGDKRNWGKMAGVIVVEEVFFYCALLFWTWIKAHEPSIQGLEKFMDYGFMNSILHNNIFPPVDMWYPPLPINYYYFGHLVTAVLTKLSGIELASTFNLMLATIFALCFTMSYSIGKQIGQIGHMRPMGQICVGLLTAFLVTLAGNMQTIYVFTQGYTGDAMRPFWELWWNFGELWAIGGIGEVWGKIGEGMNTYWYANATRFIPYTIHEFPSYSFVVSDVHGHVLSIPFVLLAIAILVRLFGSGGSLSAGRQGGSSWGVYIFYGFLCGVLLMTNALDGPIYGGLFVVVFFLSNWSHMSNWTNWAKLGIVVISAVLVSLPFLSHFKSFVSGIAVNCPPDLLAERKIGPLLFETVDKCQHSPLWMMWLLWGFFWFNGAALIIWGIMRKNFTRIERILIVLFGFSMILIIIPEFVYFKDIYPDHFRSNTMFKLGYQAFIMFSIVSGYAIVRVITGNKITPWKKRIFMLLLLPQLLLVSIYPIFSVRSYFGELKTYKQIWGLGWLSQRYPDNFAAIQWLRQTVNGQQSTVNSTIVEADGDSYTDYNQFSVFTGVPTIVGWAVHEWLWRGGYDAVSPRRDIVRAIYESEDLVETRRMLSDYNVRYVVVGTLEREKFLNLAEWKFAKIGSAVFRRGDTVIYGIDKAISTQIQ